MTYGPTCHLLPPSFLLLSSTSTLLHLLGEEQIEGAGACRMHHAGGRAVAVLCAGDGAGAGRNGELWVAGAMAARAVVSSAATRSDCKAN